MPDDKLNKELATVAGGDPPGKPPAKTPSGATVEPMKNDSTLRKTADFSDFLNYTLAQGGNPVAHKQGRAMFNQARELYGDKIAHELLDSLYIYNQRDDLKGKGHEDRINQFYSMISSNPDIEALKGRMRNFNGGPIADYHESPDVDVQAQQSGTPDSGTPAMAAK